jgi:hypothetical protein
VIPLGIFAGRGAAGVPTDPLATSILAKLSAWWEMDEASGTRLDAVGTADLIEVGTVTTAQGVRGVGDVAVAFAGAGGLRADDQAAISVPSGGGDHCLFGWAYISANSGTQYLAAKWNSSNAAAMEYAVALVSGANVNGYNGGSGYVFAGVSAPAAAAWHFYVLWRDSADGKVRLQIDSGTPAASAGTTNPSDTGNHLGFGQAGSSTTSRMTGRLQRWGFIKGAILTADERAYLYNSGAGRTYAEIVAAS